MMCAALDPKAGTTPADGLRTPQINLPNGCIHGFPTPNAGLKRRRVPYMVLRRTAVAIGLQLELAGSGVVLMFTGSRIADLRFHMILKIVRRGNARRQAASGQHKNLITQRVKRIFKCS